ncbi:MAG TPA: CHAT domain-containing protein [Chryseosolibacter sp.]|nr:CHAT domain-containing protein [Chryseosolibacter sp.]
MRAHIFLLTGLILISAPGSGQDQDSFMEKISEIYINAADPKKALEIAKQLFKDTEATKSLQTYANYLMLKQVFETQAVDQELARICQARSERLLGEMTAATNTQVSGSDATSEWLNSYYPALFATSDPQNANKAEQFLSKHPELHNFNNFNYVAYAHERNGDYEKACHNFEKALSLQGDNKKEFHSYSYYANFLARSGEFLKAEQWILRMEKLAREADEIYRKSYHAEALTTRLVYYLSIGDYEQYIEAATGLYDYFSQTMGAGQPCDPYNMSRYTVIAHGHEMLKNYKQAESMWRRRDSSHYAWIDCHNSRFPQYKQWPLAMLPLYAAKSGTLKQLTQPASFYLRETHEHFQSYREFSDISIEFLRNMHLAFLGSREYHEGFRKILTQITATRNFRESTLPFAYYGYFNMRDRNFQAAKDTYAELFRLNVGWINDVIFSFGEKAFVAYYNARLREGYDNYHSFVKLAREKFPDHFPALASQALNNLLFTKSVSLKGTRKRKQAFLKANDPAITELYERWISKKQQLIRAYRQSEDPVLKSEIAAGMDSLKSLQSQVNRLENELAARAKDFKKYLKLEAPDWKLVKNKLKEGEAAVELVRFEWRDKVYYSDTAYYAAYIVTNQSSHPEVVYLKQPARDLEQKFYRLYQNNIKYKLRDGESYNNFWKPIRDAIPAAKTIYFSPDGIYHLISLPTLFNPASGRYLLDEVDIRNTTGLMDIVEQETDAPITTAVLFGRPSYKLEQQPTGSQAGDETRSFVSNFRNNSVADLPGTEEEVVAIGAAMKEHGVQPEIYMRENATEGNLYRVRSADILHIATHGYWHDAGRANEGYRLFNAMVNSGLLMSGVVNYYSQHEYPPTHDGILTAYEAQNLELENTSLVILSACETSLGHMDAGEGIYGLQRAFRTAGAKCTMTSLWKVDDQATRDFMIEFYNSYLKTRNKFEAFKLAQKTVKEKYASPYYWGAFILSGS